MCIIWSPNACTQTIQRRRHASAIFRPMPCLHSIYALGFDPWLWVQFCSRSFSVAENDDFWCRYRLCASQDPLQSFLATVRLKRRRILKSTSRTISPCTRTRNRACTSPYVRTYLLAAFQLSLTPCLWMPTKLFTCWSCYPDLLTNPVDLCSRIAPLLRSMLLLITNCYHVYRTNISIASWLNSLTLPWM
jgi:hypothetical protein